MSPKTALPISELVLIMAEQCEARIIQTQNIVGRLKRSANLRKIPMLPSSVMMCLYVLTGSQIKLDIKNIHNDICRDLGILEQFCEKIISEAEICEKMMTTFKISSVKITGGVKALYNATGNGISEVLMLIGNQTQSVKKISEGIFLDCCNFTLMTIFLEI